MLKHKALNISKSIRSFPKPAPRLLSMVRWQCTIIGVLKRYSSRGNYSYKRKIIILLNLFLCFQKRLNLRNISDKINASINF